MLGVVPDQLDLGEVPIGFEESLPLEVHNIGGSPMGPPRFFLPSDEFRLEGDCQQIDSGGWCTINVVFAPGGLRNRGAVLTIEADGVPSFEVPLSGLGVPEGRLAFDPPEVDFLASAKGTSIFADGPVRILDIYLTGDYAYLFEIDDPPPCLGPTGPAGGCFVPVRNVDIACEGRFEAELVIVTAGDERYLVPVSAYYIC
jgi:hypothetical protein